jgi:hypothetical protein
VGHDECGFLEIFWHRNDIFFALILQKVFIFVKLHPGQFTAPRFSSLSGALMCDSK